MKRDVQGKFALKNEDYRKVRSLRLTDQTWRALGIAAECSGVTRADYLEQIVREQPRSSITQPKEEVLPRITRNELKELPCNTWQNEEIERLKAEIHDLSQENVQRVKRATIVLPQIPDLEAKRDRVLLDLKLGKQAPGYKAAQKALNRFIALIEPPR
ncbi:MAG: hypothetical protein N4J56_007009 [Chroococcidiopsis sp. SAG 2025]|uniref:hypothetical protein n=1 Tax=Chroococcidiopsis sp. SAG 2025 TaxID=171389 RepID=UPI00293746ED|nr:hypothetical protein [Chroococcidiopsis sp. SAG 2025]MDV2997304.1 hypothetical protein [Chroococcidiopsis sp. SAG 2025]